MDDRTILGRRGFLRLVSAAGASLAVPTITAASPASDVASDYTAEVGRKFFADGRVHPFRGNTIICHLDQQGPNATLFDALLDIYRQFPLFSFAPKITALPPSSYHMTIFGGANDADRRPGLWPSAVPLDAPMDDCTELLARCLRAAAIGPVAPIRMRVDSAPPGERDMPFTLRLLPADEQENARLHYLRDRLAQILGIRAPGHDQYRFHVTLAYTIRRLNIFENRDFAQFYSRIHQSVAERCPVVQLGQPEFCALEDMFAFRRLFFI